MASLNNLAACFQDQGGWETAVRLGKCLLSRVHCVRVPQCSAETKTGCPPQMPAQMLSQPRTDKGAV
jgi:hypothetical protein